MSLTVSLSEALPVDVEVCAGVYTGIKPKIREQATCVPSLQKATKMVSVVWPCP